MPRKSAEALLTPARGGELPKLDPLDTLSERQAAVWRAVVACLPPDYFSSAQTRQLAAYCSAVCEREDIERELAAEQAKKRPRFEVVSALRRAKKEWLEVENRLARSMRLTHQSVYHNETAHTRHKAGAASAAEIERELNDDAFESAE
jgi:hypothetical protein